MNRRFPRYFRNAGLLAVLMLATSVPTAVRAQRGPVIALETQPDMRRDTSVPVLGDAGANFTLAQYLDRDCLFCKALAPVAEQSLSAANYQCTYLPVHDALISAPLFEEHCSVETALKRAGIDLTQLKSDFAMRRAWLERQLLTLRRELWVLAEHLVRWSTSGRSPLFRIREFCSLPPHARVTQGPINNAHDGGAGA